MELAAGDIVLITRGTGWAVVGPLIRLFTWEWWKGEPMPQRIHAEIVTAHEGPMYEAISAQPPAVCKVVRDTRKLGLEVYRAKNRPDNMGSLLLDYGDRVLGRPYDFPTFLMFGLDWIFHISLFSKMMKGRLFYFCAELVAELYQEIGIPCSDLLPQSTSPDAIGDFCEVSDEFMRVL